MESHHLWKSHNFFFFGPIQSVSYFHIISFPFLILMQKTGAQHRLIKTALSKLSELGRCWKPGIEEMYSGLYSVTSEQCGLQEVFPLPRPVKVSLSSDTFAGVGRGENDGAFQHLDLILLLPGFSLFRLSFMKLVRFLHMLF